MNVSLNHTQFNDDSLAGYSDAELQQIYQDTLNLLPSKAPIYLPTDKIPLIEQIKGLRHVARIYSQDLDALYRPALRKLRAQYKGSKRCFLIGNGPSLNRTDLSVLKDEVTFAVNGFFLKMEHLDWSPTFYCVEDHLVAEDRAPWINQLNGPIKLFPAYLGYQFPPAPDTIFYNHRPRVSYPHGFDFSREADKITYTGCTVTFSLMQLAAYLGFEEIYLIGVDASYDIPKDVNAGTGSGTGYGVGVLDMQSDDPNHFDPDYFGKGFRWHDPQVDKMLDAYAAAKKALQGSGQTIYNATIGGKLELFERRAFHSLFPRARPPKAVEQDTKTRLEQQKRQTKRARLLVIDYTPAGETSATGQIKQNLLRDWPDARLLQIASPKAGALSLVRRNGADGFAQTPCTSAAARQAIADFAPDVILYRPLPDRPCLHDFALSVITACDTPLVTWMMDDWPERLKTTDAALYEKMSGDLKTLFARAALNLSICDEMSRAFETRYKTPFHAYANGIDPALFKPRKPHSDGPLVIRYSGSLAPDMGLDSLLAVAKAVEDLAHDGQDIRLEINARPYWIAQSGARFDGLSATALTGHDMPFAAYIDWLQGADVTLITYNFDPESIAYTRYSMGNKLPECLASGAAVLVYGPKDIATVKRVADKRLGSVISTKRASSLKAALKRLCSPKQRQKQADKARKFALKHYDLAQIAPRFADQISALNPQPAPPMQPPAPAVFPSLQTDPAPLPLAPAPLTPQPLAPVPAAATDPNPLPELQDYIHLREQQVLRLQARLEALAQERKLQRSINHGLRERIKTQDTALAEIRTQTAGQIRALRQDITALHRSTSWRITAPLRRIRQLFYYKSTP